MANVRWHTTGLYILCVDFTENYRFHSGNMALITWSATWFFLNIKHIKYSWHDYKQHGIWMCDFDWHLGLIGFHWLILIMISEHGLSSWLNQTCGAVACGAMLISCSAHSWSYFYAGLQLDPTNLVHNLFQLLMTDAVLASSNLLRPRQLITKAFAQYFILYLDLHWM